MQKEQLIKQIDGIRFIAVSLVVIQHWIFNYTLTNVPLGSIGVTLFFVISGFLITRILLGLRFKEKPVKDLLKTFYIRRFFRIFPIYYLTIFVLFILNIDTTRKVIFWLLSYTFNFYVSCFSENAIMAHFWSLAVEEQFYLFYPLIILLTPLKMLKKVIFLFIVSGLLSRLIFWKIGMNDRSNTFLTTSTFDCFGLGALLAYFERFQKDDIPRYFLSPKIIGFAIFLFLLASIAWKIYGEDTSMRVVWFKFMTSLFSTFVIAKTLYGFKSFAKTFLENPIVLYLGKISYGIYVYHAFVPYFFEQYRLDIYPHYIMVIIYAVVTLSIAIISWKLIESPINGLKDKFNY